MISTLVALIGLGVIPIAAIYLAHSEDRDAPAAPGSAYLDESQT